MSKARKSATLLIVWCSMYLFPHIAYAECGADIIGKWQQTKVVFGENQINDNSQSWEFMENESIRFIKTAPEIDVTGKYSCEDGIIYMKGGLPGRLKILEYSQDTMIWESLDHGGGVTHIKRIKQ